MANQNPCTCFGYVYTPVTPTTPCPDPNECLELCHIIIPPDNGVGPCGQAGQINVMDYQTDGNTTACGADPLVWNVARQDPLGIITTASITPEGILTWVTGPGETAGKIGVITLRACCGKFSTYIEVLIGVKDLCNCPGCGDCENCDPCTGDCIDVEVDVLIGGS